jgi:zinc protease
MAVIAVGDIDPEAMEKLIREHFAGLRARTPAARPVYPVPPHQGTRYVTVSDREAQQSTVSILYKRPKAPFNTVRDYRRIFVRSMAHQMLNERFAEMARDPNAPFLRAGSNDDTLGRDTEAFSLSLRVNDGAMNRGLEALGQEIARVRQHGFGEAELDRAMRSTLAGYERAFNERNRQQNDTLAAELVRHVLEAEPVPGIVIEAELVRGFLPTITAAEVSAMARELLGTEDNIVVMSVTPEKEGLAPVTQAALQTSLRAGLAATTTPWADTVTNRDLLARRPTPGAVRARREIPELGATVLTLSNGVEVWLKPTNFRNDQIQFTSYAHGGLSLASEADYLNASLAVALTGLSGYGGINPTDMGKILAGRLANASPYISTYSHGVSGGTTPRDLETALQLVHLSFTAPDSDPQAFELMKRRLLANIANQEQNPGTVFGERLRLLNTVNHYTAKPLRAAEVETLNAERMLAFYKARFANAADFTFFFVGAFTEAQITPLLNQYIASLPSTGASSSKAQNINLRFPMGVQREVVNKGIEPRATTVMSFFADTNIEDLEVHRLRAATQVLQMRLRDILREELGGTYSVGVGYSDTTPMPGYGTITVQFGSSPENVDKLRDAVMSEMDRLRREGPSAEDVASVKETEKRDLETSLQQNNYWMGSLQTMHMLGRDPIRITQRMQRADSLSVENVAESMRKYFQNSRYTVVTLVPETGTRPN